jgi:hypothetical protein
MRTSGSASVSAPSSDSEDAATGAGCGSGDGWFIVVGFEASGLVNPRPELGTLLGGGAELVELGTTLNVAGVAGNEGRIREPRRGGGAAAAVARRVAGALPWPRRSRTSGTARAMVVTAIYYA